MRDKMTFTLAVQPAPPYLLFNETEDKGIILYDGPDFQLLKFIQEKYGFEYNVTVAPDKEWGRNINGTWTGLIGMINRTEADIAAGCISMTYLRSQAADFTYPYNLENGVIITKKPMIKSKVYAVVMPFTKEVWALILFALIVKVFVVQRVVKRHAELNGTKIPTLSRTFWYMFGLLCNEGGRVEMFQSSIAALLIGLWMMFVVVIQSSYSGTLMSFLSIPGRETPIDTFTDLANAIITRGDFQCGYMKGSSSFETLKNLEGQLSVISEAVLSNPSNHLESVTDGLEKALGGNFAFLSQEMASSYEAQKMGISDFHMSTEGYGFEVIAFAVRKNFPYKKQFDKIIQRLMETGLIEKWKKEQMHPDSQRLNLSNEIVVTALSITELHGALLLCGYGYSLSVLVFIMEKFFILRFRKKNSTSAMDLPTDESLMSNVRKLRNM